MSLKENSAYWDQRSEIFDGSGGCYGENKGTFKTGRYLAVAADCLRFSFTKEAVIKWWNRCLPIPSITFLWHKRQDEREFTKIMLLLNTLSLRREESIKVPKFAFNCPKTLKTRGNV